MTKCQPVKGGRVGEEALQGLGAAGAKAEKPRNHRMLGCEPGLCVRLV